MGPTRSPLDRPLSKPEVEAALNRLEGPTSARDRSGQALPPKGPWGRRHVLALGGVAVALCVVWLATRWSEPVEALPAGSAKHAAEDAPQLAALRAALEQEREARERLESNVELLRARIEFLALAGAGIGEIDAPPSERDAQRHVANQEKVFDSSALVTAGVDPQDADWLRGTWEDVEMDKIYLSNMARREGWAGTPEYHEELRSLEGGLRDELNSTEYDRYLYAMGKHNRVQVTDVIDRSPGSEAGFVLGDVILSYDGERVFDTQSLGNLATSGRLGDLVRVEVSRGDSTAFLNVPRGPIGLLISPHRQEPL